MAYAVRDWMKKIKRKEDFITVDQAIDFVEGMPKAGRNVDNCYIEPYDDALDKLLDLLKRIKDMEQSKKEVKK